MLSNKSRTTNPRLNWFSGAVPCAAGKHSRISARISECRYVPKSAAEERAAAIPVLREVRRLIRRGWCRAGLARDADGREFSESGFGTPVSWSLLGAIIQAGKGEIEGEYARRALRKHVGEIGIWDTHPLRSRVQVLALLDRVLADLGHVSAPKRARNIIRPSRTSLASEVVSAGGGL